MKSIRGLIPRRRPAPAAVDLPPMADGPDPAPPRVAAADTLPDARDFERAASGRDRVPLAETEPRPPERRTMEDMPKDAITVPTRPNGAPAPQTDVPPPATGIWDLEDDPLEAPDPAPDPARGPAPDPARHRPDPGPTAADPAFEIALNPPREGGDRVRTRLLGFGGAPQADAFAAEVARADDTRFPIGWLVVIEGPGRGASFTLTAGLTTLGRGSDQSVQLDFGDTAISRHCHAAVVYDPEDRRVLVGHGGRSNIVRLNGEPLLSREELQDGDLIRLGKTTLSFVAFCGADFDWQADDAADAANADA